MKRYICWMLCLFFIVLSYCQSGHTPVSDKISIAASINPLADFARQVGGEHVDVFVIVPPGANPHQFELSPLLLKKINDADLVVLNGVGLEFWDKAIFALDHKNILDTSSGIDILDDVHIEHEHDHDPQHHHSGGNPHIWLDPINAIKQVSSIQQALIELDPEHGKEYQANANAYINKLQMLNDSLYQEIATWKQRKYITFHPAWIYFSKRYGLEQAAVIEPAHGVDAGPRAIAEIIDITNKINAGAIFTAAAHPENLSKTIADECGIPTVALDPLGATFDTKNYIDLIKYNTLQMALIMKN